MKNLLNQVEGISAITQKFPSFNGSNFEKRMTDSFNILKKTLCIAFVFLCLFPFLSSSQGFTISGTQLRDANGNNFIMKGFSVPTAWFTTDVNNNIANIRNRTGANCLRIVVTTSTSDAAWQTSVTNCIANKMIPMVELHDVTGNNSPSELNRMASFWASKASFLTRSDIARYILINIANEWSDWFMSATATGTVSRVTWRDAYKTAVQTIRNAGIRTTLVVDAAGYGQDNRTQTLLSYAKDVQASDIYHNCLFSLHLYCEWSVGGNSAISLLPAVKNAGIPVIAGEFGFQHTEGSSICDINESQIISTANSNGIGWLAWSWKGNGGGVEYLDLSNDWGGTSLSGWGNTVVNGSGGTKTATTASVFSTTTPPPPATIANGTYRITPRHSGKSLNVQGSSTADGGNIVQGPYNGSNNQKWFVVSLGGGAYSIRNVNGSKAMDVSGSSLADGADINQWTYSGNNNQRWRIESVGGGFFRIVSVNSSKCVDIPGASTADNAAINQWTCNGGSNQSFTFEQLSTTSSRVAAATIAPDQVETLMDVSVFPNPSVTQFNLYCKGTFSYTVKDILGRVIENGSSSNKVSFGQHLPAGVYFLQLKSSGITKTIKVVKN